MLKAVLVVEVCNVEGKFAPFFSTMQITKMFMVSQLKGPIVFITITILEIFFLDN